MLYTLFLISAIVGGTIMVCQFLLTVFGMSDADAGDFDAGDVDVDADHHTSMHHASEADVSHSGSTWLFEILSFRTIVAALAFFGLGGLGAAAKDFPPGVSLMIAALAGFAAMFGMYRLMKLIYGFQSAGNVNIRNAVGCPATIYIPVPASGSGKGKIQVTLQGRTMEYAAMTDDQQNLATGEHVFVENVLGNDLVKVSRAIDETVNA